MTARAIVPLAAALLTLVGCGAAHRVSPATTSAPPAANASAPQWLVRQLRHTYEPLPRCSSRPCSRIDRDARQHVLALHEATVLAPGAVPSVAFIRRLGDETVTVFLYRSASGHVCDYASVERGGRPIAGALTPGLPCVPGRPCGAICLTQIHCCGANVLAGTVASRGQELGAAFDDGTGGRFRLDGPLVRGVGGRRIVVVDLRPHGYADPVRLVAHGKVIATDSVAGLG